MSEDKGRLLRLSPIVVVAALAPVEPSQALRYAPFAAVLAVIASGRPPRPSGADLLAGALALWATASAIGSPAGVTGALDYWKVAALFVAARHVVRDRSSFVSVGVAYLVGCLYATWQLLSLRELGSVPDWRPVLPDVNVNYVAYCLATGAVVATALAIMATGRRWRVVAMATLVPIGFAVERTGTRGAMIAVVVGVAYLVACRLTGRTFWKPISIGVPVALAVVALDVYSNTHLLAFEAPFGRQSSDMSGRLRVWPYARDVWAQYPVTGVGPKSFPLVNPMQIGAHNVVLTVGAELGVVGVALLALIFATLLGALHVSPACQRFGGLLLLTWLPIWLTGHWELSPAAWLILGVWSRLPALDEGQPDATVNTSHFESVEFHIVRT